MSGFYSEQTRIVSQVHNLLQQLGRRPEISDRDGLAAALDELKETTLADFDQAAFYGKRHDDVWNNTHKLISALAELAVSDYQREEAFTWSELRAEELKPGMFVEDRRRCREPLDERPYHHILVVIYAQVVGSGGNAHLYLVATSADPDTGCLAASGGVFARGTLVRACPGVSARIAPRPSPLAGGTSQGDNP